MYRRHIRGDQGVRTGALYVAPGMVEQVGQTAVEIVNLD